MERSDEERLKEMAELFATRFAIFFLRGELVAKGVLEPLSKADVDGYAADVLAEMNSLATGAKHEREAKEVAVLTEKAFRHIVSQWRLPIAKSR